MKIVFFGSDDFAATHLNALFQSTHDVVGCVTQPDRPQGRGMKMVISPIKDIAIAHDVPCLQPASFKETAIIDALKAFKADVFVVVAYGRLLTGAVLEIPRVCCVNVHGSLLPKYRGAAPINWAIINGETTTGVTVQRMVLALDAGEIIAQQSMPIHSTTSADTLRLAMAQEGAELLVKTLDQMATGKYPMIAQDEAGVSVAPKLSKELSVINWTLSAENIDRHVRGLKPWPGSSTFIHGKILKIHQVSVIHHVHGKPGEILSIDKSGITVACGEGALLLSTVQPEAGKAMPAYDFAQGHQLNIGSILG